MRIVIIGAGPTGLGAAYRLQELGHDDWTIYEASDHIGGLAASHTDDAGFTYDLGGHVLFSHYEYFDRLFDTLLGDQYTELERESWIWMEDRFVPYPFQNNIRYLKPESTLDCLTGLIEAQRSADPAAARNFGEWIDAQFGAGIAKHFMIPYNHKVWAHPLERMSKDWMAERVAVIDVERLLRNVVMGLDDVSWGPNNTFKFPLRGGTGGLYQPLLPYIEDHLSFHKRAVSVDSIGKTVTFADGETTSYDVLLSAMPLDKLVASLESCPEPVREASTRLSHSSGMFVGIGVARPAETDKCWLYFPESSSPFYRVTYLSNYSPHIAPDGQHLLLTETSHSPHKPEDESTIVQRTIEGLIATKVLREEDRELIVASDLQNVAYTYPVPTVERDPALATVQPYLMERDIYSRGRFGAWLYEIGNMDHSVMQGVEFVNHVLQGEPEVTWIPARSAEPTLAR